MINLDPAMPGRNGALTARRAGSVIARKAANTEECSVLFKRLVAVTLIALAFATGARAQKSADTLRWVSAYPIDALDPY